MIAALWGSAPASGYSGRPIVLVNPYPASGPPEVAGSLAVNRVLRLMQSFGTPSVSDIIADHVGRGMGAALGRPVRVTRQPRGRGLAAARYVAGSPPDGSTLLLTTHLQWLVQGRRRGRDDSEPDFAPVAAAARMPLVLISGAASGLEDVRGFIELARRAPGRLNYGSSGELTTTFFAAEQFRALAGIKVLHVDFNGGAGAVNGAVKGQVQVAFVPLPAVLPNLGGGKIRMLGIADRERHETLPGLPTLAEAGLEGFEAATWFGFFAPAGTPPEVIGRLNDGVAAALGNAPTRAILLAYGLQARRLSPGEFAALIGAERGRWMPILERLVQQNGW